MDDDNSSTDAILSDEDAASQSTAQETDVTETPDPEESGDWGIEDTDETKSDDEEDVNESDESGEEPDESTEEDTTEAETDESAETPQERARREYQERSAARQQAKEQQDLIRQQQAQEYIEGAEDEKDAAIRQLQLQNYYNEVKNVETSIQNDYDSATKEIDIFNSDSDQYNEPALKDALALWQQAYVETDDVGNFTAVQKPLKQFLHERADLFNGFVQKGATRGQQAERKMRAKVEPLPTKAPSKPKSDPFMDGFSSEY